MNGLGCWQRIWWCVENDGGWSERVKLGEQVWILESSFEVLMGYPFEEM